MHDDAIAYFKNSIALDPNNSVALGNLGNAYVMKGLVELGIKEIEKASEMSQDHDLNQKSELAHAYIRAGRVEDARKILSELLKKWKENRSGSATMIAGIYGNLGQKNKAFEWLENAYNERSGYLKAIGIDFVFDCLRTDSRFDELLQKIGLGNLNPIQ